MDVLTMKPIPTAEEYISSNYPNLYIDLAATKLLMKEYAQLHVQAALEAAAENAEVTEGWNTGFSGSAASVDKDSIINAYPLTNIK